MTAPKSTNLVHPKDRGVLVVNKPKGWTSFDVIARLRKLTGMRRIGHFGTLDPMATGVLLVSLGSATKLFDLTQDKTKTYLAEFEFGYATDTLDATGKVTATTDHFPLESEIVEALGAFRGKISQIPPKYSAKSVDGVRAYTLAREGRDFDLQPKVVEIFSTKIVSFTGHRLTLEIVCGSGTYIRSICRDLAESVHSLATMTALVRIKVGRFGLSDAAELADLDKENVFDHVMKINDFLADYPELNLTEGQQKRLLNGQTIDTTLPDGVYRLTPKAILTAVLWSKSTILWEK